MFTVHGTKKFLDRVPGEPVSTCELQPVTTVLGPWYATVLFWRQHVALFVNETTRLPLLVPLAPGAGVGARMTETANAVFTALGLPEGVIASEVAAMAQHQLAKTVSRSVLGTMNDFAYLAEAHRGRESDPVLVDLSLQLASTPCGPLYRSHISPDRETVALLTGHDR